MRRRDFILAFAGSAAACPLAARAQQPGAPRVVGLLTGLSESDPVGQSLIAAFREELAKAGWSEQKNLRLEVRFGAADVDRIERLAKELVGLRPDAIFAHTTPPTFALARQTQTIPIVFMTITDPTRGGLVATVARPTTLKSSARSRDISTAFSRVPKRPTCRYNCRPGSNWRSMSKPPRRSDLKCRPRSWRVPIV